MSIGPTFENACSGGSHGLTRGRCSRFDAIHIPAHYPASVVQPSDGRAALVGAAISGTIERSIEADQPCESAICFRRQVATEMAGVSIQEFAIQRRDAMAPGTQGVARKDHLDVRPLPGKAAQDC